MRGILIHAGMLALLAVPAAGQGIASVTVTESGAEASIDLVAGFQADLSLRFDQVLGLYPGGEALGLSAIAVDPTDLSLLGRLPDSQLVTIPAAFPVLITIDPPASHGLSFSGAAMISLHTHDLTYTANSPLRLFAADDGGPFYDITYTMGMGSYRVGGSKGKFSEFMIVSDLRPASEVIDAKFGRVQDILDDNAAAVEPTVLDSLQASLDAAWSWYGAGDLVSARTEINHFIDLVTANSGAAIPSTWRSSRDLVNVAGELREGAATLRFSLSLSASP